MHAESNRLLESVFESEPFPKTDTMTIRDAFDWAARELATGATEVKIWLSGDGNVPTVVTRANFWDTLKMWTT